MPRREVGEPSKACTGGRAGIRAGGKHREASGQSAKIPQASIIGVVVLLLHLSEAYKDQPVQCNRGRNDKKTCDGATA